MHRRSDFRGNDPAFAHSITVRGVDDIVVSSAPEARQEIAS